MSYIMTKHADVRANQRGLRSQDIHFLLELGAQIAPDAYLMTDDVAAREIARRKHEIQQLERLKGKKVVVEGATVITAYHAKAREQRRSFRKGRARA